MVESLSYMKGSFSLFSSCDAMVLILSGSHGDQEGKKVKRVGLQK